MYLLLVAGKPNAIEVSDQQSILSHVSLEEPVATDLKLHLVDRWRNVTLNSIADNISIRCFLDTSASGAIRLRTDDSTGILTARQEGGVFVVGSIVLEASQSDASQVSEGVTNLIIEASDERIERLKIPISYYSDVAQAAKVQQLALELSQQERVVADFSSELAAVESRIASARAELRAVLRDLGSEQCSFDGTQRSDDLPSPSEINDQLEIIRREISDIQNAATQFRRSLKPNSAECIAHAATFCCKIVVDSIYVRAEADASVISWAASQNIDALIARSAAEARRIIRSGATGVKVLIVDNR